MKRYNFYIFGCIIALSALFLPGCNSEETLIDNSVPVEKGKLSFILPMGVGRTVTYASVTAEDAEYKMSNIRIYWFTDDDNLLYKRFASGDNTFAGGAYESIDGDAFTAAVDAHQTVVTINVGDYDGASKFYIVANINGDGTTNPDMISSDPLKNVKVGVTTEDEFEALLSDSLNKGGSVKLLGTPIPMSIRDKTGTTQGGYISVTLDHANPTPPLSATLKRRVARFDVINTADYSNFEIKAIHIANAQNKVFLHDKPFVETSDSWNSANTCKFTVTAPVFADPLAFNGPQGVNTDDNNDGVDDAFDGQHPDQQDKEYLTKAAFYLYPTIIDNNRSKTEIILEGIYNKTTPVLYTLDLSDPKYTNGEINIKANKVYRIYIHRATENKKTFKLYVDDWDDTDTIPAESKGVDVTSWGTLVSSVDPTCNSAWIPLRKHT